MERTAKTTSLIDETYEKVIESLGFTGWRNKNNRAKIRRALRKVAANGGAQPFIWLDHRGQKHLPEQMATAHLFYAIRMIWNHTVPTYFRIPGTKRYSDVPHWSLAYRKEALKVLRKELDSRPFQELTTDQLKQLSYMSVADNAIAINEANSARVLNSFVGLPSDVGY